MARSSTPDTIRYLPPSRAHVVVPYEIRFLSGVRTARCYACNGNAFWQGEGWQHVEAAEPYFRIGTLTPPLPKHGHPRLRTAVAVLLGLAALGVWLVIVWAFISGPIGAMLDLMAPAVSP